MGAARSCVSAVYRPLECREGGTQRGGHCCNSQNLRSCVWSNCQRLFQKQSQARMTRPCPPPSGFLCASRTAGHRAGAVVRKGQARLLTTTFVAVELLALCRRRRDGMQAQQVRAGATKGEVSTIAAVAQDRLMGAKLPTRCRQARHFLMDPSHASSICLGAAGAACAPHGRRPGRQDLIHAAPAHRRMIHCSNSSAGYGFQLRTSYTR